MNYTESLKTTDKSVKPMNYSDYTMLDGYAWADAQKNKGYHVIEEAGNWPYVIVVRGVAENGCYVIKEYSEHDIATWIYGSNQKEEYTNHLNQIRSE